MPRAYKLQSSFVRGVLDSTLIARTDVEAYYQGLSDGENILPLVQGGFCRRPGLEYKTAISAGDANVRLLPFSFNVEQDYIFALSTLKLEVYKDGALQATVVTPWAGADLYELRFAQSADTMIIVHPDYAPRKIVRGAAHTSWTLSTITFTNIPQFDFNDASSPTGTDEIQDLDMVTILKGQDFILKLEGYSTEVLTHAGNATAVQQAETARVIQEALLDLGNTPNTGITCAWQAANVFRITFTGGAADDWPEIIAQEVNTGTAVGVITTVQNGAARTEDIISATRGWPRTVTFHESRLWLGGTSSLPQTLLASVIGDFFNLDLGTGLDDDGIQVTIDTDQVNAIEALYSGRDLYVFTSGGEFVASAPERGVLTPSSVNIRRNTQHGSGTVQPLSIDGAVLFVERSGKVLREFFFDFAEDTYSASMVSLFSADLINSPVDMAALRGTANEQSNYVYLVNADGTVAVCNILREQKILAWVPWNTDGEFLSVAVINDEVYFAVKRTVNAVDIYYLEKLNSDLRVDAGVLDTLSPAGDVVTGLSHLEAKSVRVVADGAVQPNATVTAGQITLERDATEVEVGVNYPVRAVTMPLNIDFGNGPTFTRRKRFIEASLNVKETRGVYVDGTLIPDRQLDIDAFDEVPAPVTGLIQAYVHGWTDLAQIEIRQDDPLPMTILGLTLEVSLT